jgi:hypothetical protein
MTKRELAKIAAFGSLREWEDACIRAKREGFSYDKIAVILLLSHPVLWLAVVALVAVSTVGILHLIFG